MLTYRLRERVLRFAGDALPSYPSEATIYMELAPLPQFGGVAGVSKNAISDRTMRLKFNMSTGRIESRWEEPLFEPISTSTQIDRTKFCIEGNIVKVISICKSNQDLTDLISTVYYAYPAVLNVYYLDIPYPTHVWGNIDDCEFRWDYEKRGMPIHRIKKTSKEFQEELAVKSWKNIGIVANNIRLMGGLHYFHVACRLQESGYNKFEFMAEAILNFAKSLQSTFGESRDDIRRELKKLNIYDEKEIEAKIIPAYILRNEFDIGHVSLAMLNRQQLQTIHNYTDIAEGAFRKLFSGLLEKIEGGLYTLPTMGRHVLSPKKMYTLEKLERNLKPYVSNEK